MVGGREKGVTDPLGGPWEQMGKPCPGKSSGRWFLKHLVGFCYASWSPQSTGSPKYSGLQRGHPGAKKLNDLLRVAQIRRGRNRIHALVF